MSFRKAVLVVASIAAWLLAGVARSQEDSATLAFFQQPPADTPGSPDTGQPGELAPSRTLSRSLFDRPSMLNRSGRGSLGQSRSGYLADRLARAPNMFGDFFGPGSRATILIQGGNTRPDELVMLDLPTAGGSRRVKIAENNHALPTDRVFFVYNHFHNALTATSQLAPDRPGGKSVDRYTLGVEKTFLQGDASIELRMPFAGTYRFVGQSGAPWVEGGNIGNLALILKALLIRREDYALSVGLGIDTPTGSDLDVDIMPGGLRIENESTHFLPYVGVVLTPSDVCFFHAFGQLDLAANGNGVTLLDPFGKKDDLGSLTEQNLLYLDIGGGLWLYQNPEAAHVTGIALTSELHYSTTLQDADVISLPGLALLGNPFNRRDFLNVSIGTHLQLGPMSDLRIGGVLPLRTGVDQGFDAEVQVQFNRRF